MYAIEKFEIRIDEFHRLLLETPLNCFHVRQWIRDTQKIFVDFDHESMGVVKKASEVYVQQLVNIYFGNNKDEFKSFVIVIMKAVFDTSKVANDYAIASAMALLYAGGTPYPDQFDPTFTFRKQTGPLAAKQRACVARFESSNEKWEFFSDDSIKAWLEYCSAAQRRQ